METTHYSEVASRVASHGRTWQDAEGLHFNWTCSGFELLFEGRFLAADLLAGSTMEIEGMPLDTNAPSHEIWPWVAVFLDDSEEPSRRFVCNGEKTTQILFSSDHPEKHKIRVVKLTENGKSYLALSGFRMEGEILPLRREERCSIEFIGDSITCGFGNETRERDRFFFAEDENGWLSHGAIAARALGMDWNMVSISGITLGAREGFPMPYAMNEIFCDTDRPGQERSGIAPERWDFAAHPRDYVVLNLGTNDANAISMAKDPIRMEGEFEADYLSFLKLLRRCYGSACRIICALGSMDYYLFSNIAECVRSYREETGDKAVSLLKYMRINPYDPLGACGHPYVVTQEKMAQTLAAHIRSLEKTGV